MRTLPIVALAVTLMPAAAPAQTFNNELSVGWATIRPNERSSDVRGPFTPGGSQVGVSNAPTLAFTYQRYFTPNIGIEAVAAIPPEFDIRGVGALAGFGTLASTKKAAPTVTMNYHFLDTTAALRPFIGAGVNYTRFFDSKIENPAVTAAFGPTSLRLDDSWGPAVVAGLNYRLNERWSLSAVWYYMRIKTTVTLESQTPVGQMERRVDVDVNPSTFYAALRYRF